MANIENKNQNPIVILLANFCCLGALGYVLLGQMTKAVYIAIISIVLGWLVVGMIFPLLAAIDAYMIAQALQAGEEIDENEYKFELLYKIMSMIDKKAVFKG